MNNDFLIIFIIYQWIKLASFGSERVYYTTIVSKKNAFTIPVFQMTLSFSFHYKIFELVFLPGDFFYINTRERHMGLYATYETVVNRAWDATTQKMLLCFIFFLNRILCIPREISLQESMCERMHAEYPPQNLCSIRACVTFCYRKAVPGA